MSRIVKWLIWQGASGACLYLAFIEGQDGALNVLTLLVPLMAVVSMLTVIKRRQDPRGWVPAVGVIPHVVVWLLFGFVLAWNDHLGLALAAILKFIFDVESMQHDSQARQG